MATCFGSTFNHHQALKNSVQVPKACTLWDPGLISLRPDDG